MKTILNNWPTRRWLGAGMLLVAALSARADTYVTFTVDMSALGTPGAVYVNGDFNGWGSPGSPGLTNNGADVWSQTITITNAPGTVINFKFWNDTFAGNWESIPNRQFVLGGPGNQVLTPQAFNVNTLPIATNYVTFQVDMTQQIAVGNFVPGSGPVSVSGDYQGWTNPGQILTNNPTLNGVASNIYVGIWPVPGFPPATINYKFVYNGNYENPVSTAGGNRQASVSDGQVLPVVYFNDISPTSPTNNVKVQVDMTEQIFLGNFIPASGTINVSGSFTGWGNGLPLTNNPSLSGVASNVYSSIVPIVGDKPFPIQYKFRMNGGWENDRGTPSHNLEASITNTPQVLPLVYYNDITPSSPDVLQNPVTVTFAIQVPNGTPDAVTGYTFGTAQGCGPAGADQIFINGDWLGWAGWGACALPANQQMVQSNNSSIYTNSFVIPGGNPIKLVYKYSFNGIDDENGFATNHVREIRIPVGVTTYAMPLDVWSWSVLQPGNGNPYTVNGQLVTGLATTNIAEPDFGFLAIGPDPGPLPTFPITWLGRQFVFLQDTTNLASGVWHTNISTSGFQSTNWPNDFSISGPANHFFRLMKQQ